MFINAGAIKEGIRASVSADQSGKVTHKVKAKVIGSITKTTGWWLWREVHHGVKVRIEDAEMGGFRKCFIGLPLVRGFLDESWIPQETTILFRDCQALEGCGEGAQVLLTFVSVGVRAQFYAGEPPLCIQSVEVQEPQSPTRG